MNDKINKKRKVSNIWLSASQTKALAGVRTAYQQPWENEENEEEKPDFEKMRKHDDPFTRIKDALIGKWHLMNILNIIYSNI